MGSASGTSRGHILLRNGKRAQRSRYRIGPNHGGRDAADMLGGCGACLSIRRPLPRNLNIGVTEAPDSGRITVEFNFAHDLASGCKKP
jgi:hypothetical protein